MKHVALVVVLLALTLPAPARAAGIEVAAYVGKVNPTWSQSFSYAPVIPDPFPGVSVRQNGGFRLDATGGVAIGGGVTLFFADAVGIEARLDSADISVESDQTSFRVSAALPAPLPPLATDVELPPAVSTSNGSGRCRSTFACGSQPGWSRSPSRAGSACFPTWR